MLILGFSPANDDLRRVSELIELPAHNAFLDQRRQLLQLLRSKEGLTYDIPCNPPYYPLDRYFYPHDPALLEVQSDERGLVVFLVRFESTAEESQPV